MAFASPSIPCKCHAVRSLPRAVLTLWKSNPENVQDESHLRPVTHSPHKAFRVILTVLSLPGSGGEDAFLPRVRTPHSPVTHTFATLNRTLEENIREFERSQD